MEFVLYIFSSLSCIAIGIVLVRLKAYLILPMILVVDILSIFLFDIKTSDYLQYGFMFVCFGFVTAKIFFILKRQKALSRQPGLLSKYRNNPNMNKWNTEELQRYKSTFLAGTDESNEALIDLIKSDMEAVGLVFLPYEASMKGGRRAALLVAPNDGCRWYLINSDGTWTRKMHAKEEIADPQIDGYDAGYTIFVGFFYIKPKKGSGGQFLS